MVRGHTVDFSGLLAGGGRSIDVADEVPIEAFEGIRFEQPAKVRLELRYAQGWLETRGSIDARATGGCDVCLEPVEFDVHVDVDERFDPNVGREAEPFGESNVIVGGRIDVEDLARQVVLSALPMGVRCGQHSSEKG